MKYQAGERVICQIGCYHHAVFIIDPGRAHCYKEVSERSFLVASVDCDASGVLIGMFKKYPYVLLIEDPRIRSYGAKEFLFVNHHIPEQYSDGRFVGVYEPYILRKEEGVQLGGLRCEGCGECNEYAVSNLPNGRFKCYGCRRG